MSDLMWGGVPFRIPSKTAIKYLSGAVKVQREVNLPVGGRYNARKTMEREIPGHRQARLDREESYANYDKLRSNRSKTEPRVEAVVSAAKKNAGHEYERPLDPIYHHEKCCSYRPCLTRCPMFKITKPKIGNTEPRAERFLGMVDCRILLPGYVGGKRVRNNGFSTRV